MEKEKLSLNSTNFLLSFLYENEVEQKRQTAKSLAKTANIPNIDKFPKLAKFCEMVVSPSQGKNISILLFRFYFSSFY